MATDMPGESFADYDMYLHPIYQIKPIRIDCTCNKDVIKAMPLNNSWIITKIISSKNNNNFNIYESDHIYYKDISGYCKILLNL